MKSFAKLAVAGVSGVILFKLFATLIIPLLGMLFGILALTVKLAVIAAVVFFVYSLVRKPEQDKADGEIVVDPPDDASAEA
jgi:hypothetical protein